MSLAQAHTAKREAVLLEVRARGKYDLPMGYAPLGVGIGGDSNTHALAHGRELEGTALARFTSITVSIETISAV